MLLYFDPVARVWLLSYGVEDKTLQKCFLNSVYLFDSIFPELLWFDQLHSCAKGIYLLNNGFYENGKKMLVIMAKVAKRENALSKHECYTFELPLIKLS